MSISAVKLDILIWRSIRIDSLLLLNSSGSTFVIFRGDGLQIRAELNGFRLYRCLIFS